MIYIKEKIVRSHTVNFMINNCSIIVVRANGIGNIANSKTEFRNGANSAMGWDLHFIIGKEYRKI